MKIQIHRNSGITDYFYTRSQPFIAIFRVDQNYFYLFTYIDGSPFHLSEFIKTKSFGVFCTVAPKKSSSTGSYVYRGTYTYRRGKRVKLFFYNSMYRSFCNITKFIYFCIQFSGRSNHLVGIRRNYSKVNLFARSLLNRRYSGGVTVSKVFYTAYVRTYKYVTFFRYFVFVDNYGYSNFGSYYVKHRPYFGLSGSMALRLLGSFCVSKRSFHYVLFRHLIIFFRLVFLKSYVHLVPPIISSLLPLIMLRTVKRGKRSYKVPYSVSFKTRDAFSVKLFLKAVSKYSNIKLIDRLLIESSSIVLSNESEYTKLLSDHYNDAVAGRIFVHFRW